MSKYSENRKYGKRSITKIKEGEIFINKKSAVQVGKYLACLYDRSIIYRLRSG